MFRLLKPNITSLLRRRLAQTSVTFIPTRGRIMASTNVQPHWEHPQPSSYKLSELNLEPPLKVFNSLTRSKDDFVPEKSDAVTW